MFKKALCRLGAVVVLVCMLSAALVSSPTAQNARPSTRSQPPPLMIGGQNFRIGMSRQEAMALIAECCSTLGDSETSMSLIQKTGDSSMLGSISFKGGRVSRLTSDVKQIRGKDTSDFVLALYRTILNGQTTATGTVNISAFPDELSNGINRYILLTYPNGRILRITQFAVDNGQVGAEIEEER